MLSQAVIKIGRTIKLHGRSKSVLGRITTKFAAKSRPGTRSYLEMMNATGNDQGHQSQGQGHGVHRVSYVVSCVSVSCLCPVSVVYIDLLRSLWI